MTRIINGMKRLLLPGAGLMMKLNFAKKAILLGLVTLIALSVISVNLYQHLKDDAIKAQHELVGIGLLLPLIKTTQLLQQHRGLSRSVLADSETHKEQRLSILGSAVKAFKEVDESLSRKQKASVHWLEIRESWNVIQDKGMKWSREKNFSEHSLLIGKFHAFIWFISDEHYLTTPNDIATHHLLNTALHNLLSAQEVLGKVRALGTGILARKAASDREKRQIHMLIHEVQSSVEALDFGLKRAADYNPTVKQSLLVSTKSMQNDVRMISDLVSHELLNGQYLTAAKDYFDFTSVIIDGSYKVLNQKLLPTAQRLIEQKLASAKTSLTVSFSIVILAFVIVLYFSIGIYLATAKSIKSITRVATAFSKGNFSQRLQIAPENELNTVAQSFNMMADKLIQLQRAQKMDALGKLVGGIAHDYNNMLGVVLGYTNLITMKYSNVEGLQKYIDNIAQAGERGRKLTQRMLAFSKQESTHAQAISMHVLLDRQKELLAKAVTVRINIDYKLCETSWLTWVDWSVYPISYLDD